MKHIWVFLCTALLLLAWQVVPARAGFWDWDDARYHIDTVVVGENVQTGQMLLANGMFLDQRVERFVFVDQVGVGDRVRLVFDDTNFLRRVYRLP